MMMTLLRLQRFRGDSKVLCQLSREDASLFIAITASCGSRQALHFGVCEGLPMMAARAREQNLTSHWLKAGAYEKISTM